MSDITIGSVDGIEWAKTQGLTDEEIADILREVDRLTTVLGTDKKSLFIWLVYSEAESKYLKSVTPEEWKARIDKIDSERE